MLLLKIVDNIFFIYMLMLFANIISSWFPEFRRTRLMQFILFYTEPYFNIFRRFIPPLGMFDLSPIVAFFALQFIEWLVIKFLIVLFFR
ncbi:MAG: YggT family protein [Parachlamydiaceae bacterium]|nr:YggT family protein [Parachlamydiaceae bacterium]